MKTFSNTFRETFSAGGISLKTLTCFLKGLSNPLTHSRKCIFSIDYFGIFFISFQNVISVLIDSSHPMCILIRLSFSSFTII